MTNYTEPELVVPALRLLRANREGLTTTELIAGLREELDPSGRDTERLAGRNDDYFSQKVRNLVSHDTLVRRGFATFDSATSTHRITKEGLDHLETTHHVPEAPVGDGSEPEPADRPTSAAADDRGGAVEEGTLATVEARQRRRSRRLRDAKIAQLRDREGALVCAACGFDFAARYGDLGEGYIEIHHREPVHRMDAAGEEVSIESALERLAPLCANCHRMVHRNPDRMLTLDELAGTLRDP